mmetsp:Transcript_126575/g.319689  ORF Transcript_126575/g.319689 Transcript_126575/m.319689 type:complete len:247 (-) Transcript_126575:1303-2043(-)
MIAHLVVSSRCCARVRIRIPSCTNQVRTAARRQAHNSGRMSRVISNSTLQASAMLILTLRQTSLCPFRAMVIWGRAHLVAKTALVWTWELAAPQLSAHPRMLPAQLHLRAPSTKENPSAVTMDLLATQMKPRLATLHQGPAWTAAKPEMDRGRMWLRSSERMRASLWRTNSSARMLTLLRRMLHYRRPWRMLVIRSPRPLRAWPWKELLWWLPHGWKVQPWFNHSLHSVLRQARGMSRQGMRLAHT